MTTSELSLDHPKEIIDAYRANKFNSIFIRSLNPYGLAKDNEDWPRYFDRFVEFYKIALDYIKTELNIDEEAIGWKIERDLEMTSKLKNSYYIYEVDVNTSRGKEIELEIDGRNGKVIYVEVDRY